MSAGLMAARLLVLLLSALAVSAACLRAWGPPGLVGYVALWVIAVPVVLGRTREAVWREWPGALFVLLTAASADYLDASLGVEQSISLAMVLGSAAYLCWRHRTAAEIARTPVVAVLMLFLVQQVCSAFALGVEDAPRILNNRLSVMLSLLAGGVLVRRAGGDRLLPLLVILGALSSVPLMVHEMLDSSVTLFADRPPDDRAGGLFANANGAGSALSFAVAFALGLRARGVISRGATGAVLAACAVGLAACASRGSLTIVLVLLGAAWWLRLVHESGRWPLVRATLAVATLVAAVPMIHSAIPTVESRLEGLGVQNAGRLLEVARAVTGSPDELIEDDSHRLSLVEQSLPMIAARPWFGYGTGGFHVIKELNVHNQLLAVIGENGAVGFVLYLAFLVMLFRALARVPEEHRIPCVLVTLAWLLHHVDSHNLLDYRNAILPIAYVCGVRARADCVAAPAV